ncbi:MAG: hypothetical protein KTR18_11895 [Acidiferrobacterales bacterium]|nr:hypothetical protein [Acidiferrobacterales bacterium]
MTRIPFLLATSPVKVCIVGFLLVSQVGFADDAELEGVWVLNKSKTEQSLRQNDVSLPPRLIKNLERSYDNLAYIFKGNRTTYTPKDTIEDQPNWYTWKMQDSTPHSVSILISGLDENVTFSREKDCIGLFIEDYAYSEFYCLQSF